MLNTFSSYNLLLLFSAFSRRFSFLPFLHFSILISLCVCFSMKIFRSSCVFLGRHKKSLVHVLDFAAAAELGKSVCCALISNADWMLMAMLPAAARFDIDSRAAASLLAERPRSRLRVKWKMRRNEKNNSNNSVKCEKSKRGQMLCVSSANSK